MLVLYLDRSTRINVIVHDHTWEGAIHQCISDVYHFKYKKRPKKSKYRVISSRTGRVEEASEIGINMSGHDLKCPTHHLMYKTWVSHEDNANVRFEWSHIHVDDGYYNLFEDITGVLDITQVTDLGPVQLIHALCRGVLYNMYERDGLFDPLFDTGFFGDEYIYLNQDNVLVWNEVPGYDIGRAFDMMIAGSNNDLSHELVYFYYHYLRWRRRNSYFTFTIIDEDDRGQIEPYEVLNEGCDFDSYLRNNSTTYFHPDVTDAIETLWCRFDIGEDEIPITLLPAVAKFITDTYRGLLHTVDAYYGNNKCVHFKDTFMETITEHLFPFVDKHTTPDAETSTNIERINAIRENNIGKLFVKHVYQSFGNGTIEPAIIFRGRGRPSADDEFKHEHYLFSF